MKKYALAKHIMSNISEINPVFEDYTFICDLILSGKPLSEVLATTISYGHTALSRYIQANWEE